MSWQGIQEHDAVVERFRRAILRGRLASSFLFVGPPGIGKRTFAGKLAQTLLCIERDAELMEPCQTCPSCRQVLAETHPDLLTLCKPADKSIIPVELIIGPKERRMREGLCHDVSLKPFMGGRKVAIIDDADHLHKESANALLKTLEEPPPGSVMILIGTTASRQLPTIRSRCQTVRFSPLSDECVARLLLDQGIVSEEPRAHSIGASSGGSMRAAMELADESLWVFRTALLRQLSELRGGGVALARSITAEVEAAGKDAPARRDRLRQITAITLGFYGHILRQLGGASDAGNDDLGQSLEAAIADWPGDEELAIACQQRCLETLTHIERNAHLATLVECWIDDLAILLA